MLCLADKKKLKVSMDTSPSTEQRAVPLNLIKVRTNPENNSGNLFT